MTAKIETLPSLVATAPNRLVPSGAAQPKDQPACGANEMAKEAEATLVRRFKEAFGRLPFANIADPSR